MSGEWLINGPTWGGTGGGQTTHLWPGPRQDDQVLQPSAQYHEVLIKKHSCIGCHSGKFFFFLHTLHLVHLYVCIVPYADSLSPLTFHYINVFAVRQSVQELWWMAETQPWEHQYNHQVAPCPHSSPQCHLGQTSLPKGPLGDHLPSSDPLLPKGTALAPLTGTLILHNIYLMAHSLPPHWWLFTSNTRSYGYEYEAPNAPDQFARS